MTKIAYSLSTIKQCLKHHFGYDDFRDGQEPLIRQLLRGGDCLGVMPTGAGKSLCYQIPALVLDGLTLVVSPLISLMKDQVDALREAGVAAAFLNSSLAPQERTQVMRDACDGRYQLLYLAPERLDTEDFRYAAAKLAISLIAVDEAHCISQWGQDFRPSYLRIRAFIDSLPSRPPVGAFTATATAPVREDIVSLLNLKEPLTVSTGFDRPNLYFAVKRPRDKDSAVIDFLREDEHRGQSGIIYCATRVATDDLYALLKVEGFAVVRYHAGMSELERHRNQNDFINDTHPIMVATNAFGMGIDKSNVGFVIHYNSPKNLESYYQEAGRAGRDGSPATCLLLYAPADVQTARYLITHSSDGGRESVKTAEAVRFASNGGDGSGYDFDNRSRNVDGSGSSWDREARDARQEKDLELLKHMTFYATTNDCLRRFILGYFGETTVPLCDNCSNCHSTFEEVDATLDAQKILSCVYRLQERGRSLGKGTIVNILRGSKAARISQFGLDELSTYGIMATVAPDRIYRVIDHLLASGQLALTGANYPVVQLANDWRALLAKDAHYRIKLPQVVERSERSEKKPTTQRGRTDVASLTSPEEFNLFERLRKLRFDIAKVEGIAAYIVFSDATLRNMAVKRPTTEDELLRIPGVGKVKLERYGAAFLDCIKGLGG